jgi:hypothetical protein
MFQKLSGTRPQCGLPLETLEEKILALMRKMLRDERVRFVVPVSNNAATSWNRWFQGGLPVVNLNHSAATTPHISLPVMNRLTNDLRSHPVRGALSWTWLQKWLQV